MKDSAKGIIIVATGHPYYGRQAYNLAVSIKAVEDIPVSVLFSGRALNHLSEQQLSYFDKIIEMEDTVPQSSGAKLWSYEYTPYKETLLLDADMLWLPKKKPSELFEEVKDVEFTAITEGYHDGEDHGNPIYFFWANVSEIREVYKVTGTIYQWRTEVMYFKKSAKVNKLFSQAKKIFLNPKLASVKKFADGVPDELALNIAAAQQGVEPHVQKWQPAFWWKLNNQIVPGLQQLYSYYLASFGSNTASQPVKLMYNRIMKSAAHKLGVTHVFPLYSKREYLPERSKT
jgi:hypothetical protein